MVNKPGIQLTKASKILLNRLAKAGKIDMRPVFKIIGIGYRKEVGQIFSKKQPRQAGSRWPQLSEPYGTRKEVLFPGNPLLVRTGRLRLSMTIKGHPDNITLIGKNQAVFGSTVPYAGAHDEGTSKAGRSRNVKIPKRNFSEPSDRRTQIWKGQITKGIRRSFEKEGIDVTGDFFV